MTDVLQARGSHDSLVIIDNPHPDHTRELIAAAVAGDGPKLIITIANPRAVQTFNFGQDARVKTLRLQPLTEPESRELLRSAGAELDYSVESWVIQKAGVNPSILIAAAAVGKKLRVTGPRFLDQLGDELEARARDVLGDVGVKIIRCVSMMTALGISGPVAEELTTVCGVFGDVTPNHVLSNIPRLAGSGFIRQIGNYLEASPPVLANRAARLFLAGREKQLGVLLSGLPSHARVRLLRRIQQLPGEAIEAFIAELFHDGPLQNFERALSDVQLLGLLAPAAPQQVAKLLEHGLSQLSIDERLQLRSGIRRDLVWTLEELLLRAATSGAALRCLRLLAEAETETYANNATRIFEECFYPLHPQLPLTISDRLSLIRDLAADGAKQSKLMAIKAGAAAFDANGVGYYRRSEAWEPSDEVPQMTYGQIYEYLEAVLDQLRTLIKNEDA